MVTIIYSMPHYREIFNTKIMSNYKGAVTHIHIETEVQMVQVTNLK